MDVPLIELYSAREVFLLFLLGLLICSLGETQLNSTSLVPALGAEG